MGRWHGSVIEFERTIVAKTPVPSEKQEFNFVTKTVLKCRDDLITRKNPLEVTTQLLIFRYHDATGAIDVLLLRFGCQQEDHFVRALWICGKFASVGTGANIR